MESVKLGQKVRDRITGLEGIVVARSEWLFGCVRLVIQPQELKDGKPVEASHVDEPQVEIIDAVSMAPTPPARPEDRKHGPRPDATRQSTPSR